MGLRIAALELAASWDDVTGTLARADALLGRAPADLALLPEAALTGYVSPSLDFDLSPFAEPLEGPTARALSALAVRHRLVLLGPLIERDEERCFNSVVGFAPTGQRVVHYRKRHPWFPETWATPGELPYPRFVAGGATLTLAVCFDVHFLNEDALDVLAQGVDALLFPSAWVDDGPEDGKTPLLRALARRWGITVVNANWAPGVVRVPGQGGSVALDDTGAELAHAVDGRLDVTVPAG